MSSLSSPAANLQPPASSGSRAEAILQSYFRSGWAFLIPYLAAYLLYAWLKWPVNPAAGGEGLVKGISESGTVVGSQWSVVPPLLHVYWFLHAFHLVLGVVALRAWWRSFSSDQTSASGLPSPAFRAAYATLPWLCFALLFWIPGFYFEWPSDPWEHYARINEWARLSEVMQHYAWFKSAYFFAYSFVGEISPPLQQLAGLNLYYTACCLLLAVQHGRLARTLGLGQGASLLFVILQLLLVGNNVFSFHRYYGISSTLFSQLGSIALVRIAILCVRPPPGDAGWLRNGSPWRIACVGASAVALLMIIAFNHVQGLAIAGLGIVAVGCWWSCARSRRFATGLAFGLIALNFAAIAWLPRHLFLDTVYVPGGWLTSWYSFNLFSLSSPALIRVLQIIGIPGLVSIGLAIWLLRRNHLAAWLTLIPLFLLSLPLVAIPLANLLAAGGEPQAILTFHRLLLAMPLALPFVIAGEQILQPLQNIETDRVRSSAKTGPAVIKWRNGMSFGVFISILAAGVLLPTNQPIYSRLYNVLAKTPNDLSMRPLLARAELLSLADARYYHSIHPAANQSPIKLRLVAPPGIAFVYASTGRRNVMTPSRLFQPSFGDFPSYRIEKLLLHTLPATGTVDTLAIASPSFDISTPASHIAAISGHWLTNEVALEYAGTREIAAFSGVVTMAVEVKPAKP